MPTYEMPLLLRVMKQSEYASVLRRVADNIFDKGGFIRKIENWGEKELPCKAKSNGKIYKEACHFLVCFDVPPSLLKNIKDDYMRDVDIVRASIYNKVVPNSHQECTLNEELLPPPYRPSVQKLLQLAKNQKSKKNEFKYNSGLDYYPFLR
ncbi:mitochondrial ribosomal protein S6 [Colletes latitarsis]|uniref:mitochondrial ribosomal protein S6 n=1 Tax=Colletes latitarsis TaxID=2605962 RepID=UPI004036B4D1